MKLVLVHNGSYDYTSSGTTTIPLEGESVEHTELEFLIACETADRKDNGIFWFRDYEFDVSDFYHGTFIHGKWYPDKLVYQGPTFMTLEDWFEDNKMKQAFPENKEK